MLLTNNEAKLQEIFYDDERHQDRIQPNQPAATPSSTRLQNDTTISSTVKQVDTLFHWTRLDLFSRFRPSVPVTVNTLRLLEMSDYCCLVVLFHLRKRKKKFNFGRHRTNCLFLFGFYLFVTVHVFSFLVCF